MPMDINGSIKVKKIKLTFEEIFSRIENHESKFAIQNSIDHTGMKHTDKAKRWRKSCKI
jgi:hypothetical protein